LAIRVQHGKAAGSPRRARLKWQPKCEGTVEGHRRIAFDVREMIRQHVFDQPVGSVFRLTLRFPWPRMMRLSSSSLELRLVTGRIVIVPPIWAAD